MAEGAIFRKKKGKRHCDRDKAGSLSALRGVDASFPLCSAVLSKIRLLGGEKLREYDKIFIGFAYLVKKRKPKFDMNKNKEYLKI